jgi:ABC-type multidrug transport system fused ATPase/permease subunit
MTVGDNTAGTRSAAGENNSSGGGNIPRVEFRNVSLRYGEAAEDSLSDISFKVAAGQTVGIIGGTGSGKSSLINMIPRFYDARSGQVLVDGVDVKDYNLQQLRGKIGVVPQKAVLFQGTIAENIRWGKRDATDEEVDQALEVAQAKNFVDEKDGGKNFKISQGGKNLSGGQKQRLTIARALVRKPEILILDDSASALDFATDAALRKAIRNSSGNTTLFIVSQRASTIMNSDEIVVMDDGQIAGIGSHAELLKTCEVYREICSSQLSEEEMA